jgi:hypothetical protein
MAPKHHQYRTQSDFSPILEIWTNQFIFQNFFVSTHAVDLWFASVTKVIDTPGQANLYLEFMLYEWRFRHAQVLSDECTESSSMRR